MSEYDLIPQTTLSSLQRYERGIPTGGFLYSVLSNNLFDAVTRADEQNKLALVEIVKYIYNKMPMQCHGSEEKVNAWLSKDSKEYLDRI